MDLYEAPLRELSQLISGPFRKGLRLVGCGDYQALDAGSVLALLDRHDLLILRGFNFDAKSFDNLGANLFSDTFTHHNRARRRMQGSVSTDLLPADGSHRLPHIERGYAPGIPDLIAFYCERPAEEGGNTTFQHGADIYRNLSVSARRFFSETNFRWTLRIRRAIWNRVLGARSKDAIETAYVKRIRRFVSDGLGERVTYSFARNDLLVQFITPATRHHPVTGEPMFVNGSLAFLQDVQAGVHNSVMLTLENDEAVPVAWLEDALASASSCTLQTMLMPGDIAIANNHAVLHGRTKFTDPNRRLLVQFGIRKRMSA